MTDNSDWTTHDEHHDKQWLTAGPGRLDVDTTLIHALISAAKPNILGNTGTKAGGEASAGWIQPILRMHSKNLANRGDTRSRNNRTVQVSRACVTPIKHAKRRISGGMEGWVHLGDWLHKLKLHYFDLLSISCTICCIQQIRNILQRAVN